jgi:hypothetical protein
MKRIFLAALLLVPLASVGARLWKTPFRKLPTIG